MMSLHISFEASSIKQRIDIIARTSVEIHAHILSMIRMFIASVETIKKLNKKVIQLKHTIEIV